eukprot:TRINITY_DN15796_c0_g2_i1.p1 TRINITY_DN15796_c0_g2~~TRINITY_DN15796_c0_g2_i1.p1  ORF type:complete len:598 (+),score=174.42 TRINITY_DN15796_c0_g2_i1:82-1794(+)
MGQTCCCSASAAAEEARRQEVELRLKRDMCLLVQASRRQDEVTRPVSIDEQQWMTLAQRAFAEADADGNGTLCLKELRSMLAMVFPQKTEQQIESLATVVLRDADADGDGAISFGELLAYTVPPDPEPVRPAAMRALQKEATKLRDAAGKRRRNGAHFFWALMRVSIALRERGSVESELASPTSRRPAARTWDRRVLTVPADADNDSARAAFAEAMRVMGTFSYHLEGSRGTFIDPESAKSLPLCAVCHIADVMLQTALAIQCVEAAFVAIRLTQAALPLRRFGLSFLADGVPRRPGGPRQREFKHLVLGVECHGLWGALGISRCSELMTKPLQYQTLEEMIEGFNEAWTKENINLISVTLGGAIPHDSARPLCWGPEHPGLLVRMPLDDGGRQLLAEYAYELTTEPPSPRDNCESPLPGPPCSDSPDSEREGTVPRRYSSSPEARFSPRAVPAARGPQRERISRSSSYDEARARQRSGSPAGGFSASMRPPTTSPSMPQRCAPSAPRVSMGFGSSSQRMAPPSPASSVGFGSGSQRPTPGSPPPEREKASRRSRRSPASPASPFGTVSR